MDSHADKIRRPLDSKPVSPQMFAHFVLRTANRSPLRDWYLKVLNARQVFENEYISFITYDDEHHRVAFVQVPGLKKAMEAQTEVDSQLHAFQQLVRAARAVGIDDRLQRFDPLPGFGRIGIVLQQFVEPVHWSRSGPVSGPSLAVR